MCTVPRVPSRACHPTLQVSAVCFYVIAMVIGRYLLMNLLISVILDSFEDVESAIDTTIIDGRQVTGCNAAVTPSCRNQRHGRRSETATILDGRQIRNRRRETVGAKPLVRNRPTPSVRKP